jgi:hypothetical protein
LNAKKIIAAINVFKEEKPKKIITYEPQDNSIIKFNLNKPIEIEGLKSVKKKLDFIKCVLFIV